MRSSSLLSVAALLPFAYAQLNDLAKAAGLTYFGSATDNSELTDTEYTSILSNTSEFGQITPGNTQKWEYTEATEGTFDYTKGDVITSFAANNSQLVRCHNLIWYSQLPSWVSSGTWTNATLIAAMKAHIQSEVTHYKGQCYAWDVVNEAFDDSGNYRTSVFYETIGPEYIPIAFETAALYDPNVKLYYNDYNIEYAGVKATAALNLVKDLKARGIQIDGVGMQGHFIVGSTPSLATQSANLKSFIDLGVEVAYTELDIRFSSLPPTSTGLTTQATDYVNTVQACLDNMPGCVGVTIWDYTDKYSWVPSTFSGAGDACLWYANYTHHPAYDAVTSVLASYSGSGTAASATAAATTAATSATSVAVVATTLATSVKSSVAASSSVAAVQTSAPSAAPVTTSATSVAVAASSSATVVPSPADDECSA
ncbi:putative endo-1,4-beta-xylanase [Coleophoma crateriformis]|uniref:Beta-xylanase n=1 Tax=Coleophoma crateriformis TaxID=565419 RepID=A0A3D8R2F4_9HELO|nr:putative endo-1,4-beta-xylanase [Coleophoma crateriformis]